jgi:hypothetical protein
MELFEQLKRQQNLPLGIAAGLVAAIVGGAVWAGITVASQMQIGWIAVGVGFLVGLAVRKLGKGLTKPFGIASGALALLGCLFGNFLAMCGLIAQTEAAPFPDVVLSFIQDPQMTAELMKNTFSPMDILFYGIAVYEGYRLSFREISDKDLDQMLG